MIQEDAPPPPDAAGPPASEPPDTVDSAIGAAAKLVMALSSAIADVAFADAARVRTELQHALSRATSLAARLSDRAERAKALRRLGKMRKVAIRMFQIAPAPSTAAIAAADSGDRAAWIREEQAWIADRLARGTNPRVPRLRRERRDTRPDSPKALRLTSGEAHDAGDATAQPALAALRSADDERSEMTTRHRSLAEPSPPVHRLRRLARTLRRRFAALVGLLVALLARTWRQRPVARVDFEPTSLTREEVPDAPPAYGPPAECSPGFADPRALADVEVIEVAAEFSEQLYAPVLAQLQLGRGSKLLDLRAARVIKIGLFDRLAGDWRAPRGAVPRLGIVLGFEQWTVLRNVAARRLRPLADHGVAIEIFYPQQSESLPDWFAGGDVRHDRLREVIAWLRTEWRPGPIWPTVLGRAATLIQNHAEIDAVPEMLLELAAIARSFAGAEGAEQAAQHARAALSWVGDQPSRARCRALRAVAAAILSLGQTEVGLALLETAITTAAVLRDPIEEASALAEIGFHALRRGHVARAERRFRTALALLSTDSPAYLRATLHHDLALVLHTQRKDAEEAERHATTALGLRWDRGSQLAREDRALIALISAQRAALRG